MHDLQEAAIVPGLSAYAFDISAVVPADSWYGALLAGTLNLTPQPSVVETIAWAAYLIPTLYLFLRPSRTRTTPAPAA